MATTINTVKARESLRPRHAPYFTKLGAGQHLGFRKLTTTTAGVWVARHRDEETGAQALHSLGTFDELAPTDRFAAARQAAEDWFKHLGRGGKAEVVTVQIACERYVEHVREDGRAKTADEMKARFGRWVYADKKLAALPLPKLTQEKVIAWRRNLRKTPAPVGRSKENTETRDRSESSVNRDSTALRAALNFAHDRGWVTTDMAWRVTLRPTKNADGRRDAYLDRGQRRAFIKAADTPLGSFLTALSLVPLRPGALAALTVANFDRKLGVLSIGKDKTGQARRIALPTTTAAFFAALAKDKLPGAPLLTQEGGKAWNKDAWKWPVKDAAKAAGLADTVTAYSLRHSTITDLVSGGLDLLTVAQLSGTSVAMIEKHYGHLQSDRASAALEMLAL